MTALALTRIAAALLALGLQPAASASASPVCPQNTLAVTFPAVTSTLPRDSTSWESFDHTGIATAFAAYDIPHGTLRAVTGSTGPAGAVAQVSVQDDFTVAGLPPGTPVSIVAVLHASLQGGSSASMSDTNGHSVYAPGGGGDVTLPISALAAQPFRLEFDASSFVSGVSNARADGAFRFTGLPPGAIVVSCNGYVGDQSVPTKSISWGRLKSHYR